jgi:hypothetical protein
MFALTAPTMLGLCKRADVLPKVTAPTRCSELGFHVDSRTLVEQFFEAARQIGAQVLQEPIQMDFG